MGVCAHVIPFPIPYLSLIIYAMTCMKTYKLIFVQIHHFLFESEKVLSGKGSSRIESDDLLQTGKGWFD